MPPKKPVSSAKKVLVTKKTPTSSSAEKAKPAGAVSKQDKANARHVVDRVSAAKDSPAKKRAQGNNQAELNTRKNMALKDVRKAKDLGPASGDALARGKRNQSPKLDEGK